MGKHRMVKMKSKVIAGTTAGLALCLMYVGFKWGEDMMFIAGIFVGINAVWDIVELVQGKEVK